ncbi:MAG TPA: EamA family transporter, partial [Blastocatellia bacterium]|nr:EamA family transporter [Blastocatellia bacterium]
RKQAVGRVMRRLLTRAVLRHSAIRNRQSAIGNMKTIIVLFIAICAQTLGDIYLTKGMKSIGEINTLNPVELFNIGLQVFTNPMIWRGLLLLGIFFGLYLAALSWADLSFVLPITAFGYTLNAILARRMLGEHVSLARWVGTIIICVGVAVVSRTEQSTAGPESGGVAG